MNKTKREILEKIKTNKIKMRPKWKFVAEEIGGKVVTAIVLIGASVAMATVGVFVDRYNPIELSKYGEIGWQLLREDFPYLWLISALVLGIAGWQAEEKLGDNYKREWWFWAGVTVVAVTIMSVIIANLNLVGQ